jgi:hypothetical protein
MHERESQVPARAGGAVPASTATRSPTERLVALQRGAGNRRMRALLRAQRTLQRSVEDDLRAGPPPEPIPTGRADLPPGTAKWTEGEQSWRIPMRLYDLDELPPELDDLTMGLGVRGAPGSPPVIRGTITIAGIRRDQAREGDRRRVAIGLHAGRPRLLGYDCYKIDQNMPVMKPGFVFSDPRSGRVAEALVAARVRTAVGAGLGVVKFSIASPEVLKFHERIADAGKATRPRDGTWALNTPEMANLLAEWDQTLSAEQRAALRTAGANEATRLADVAALIAPPAPASPAPSRLPPGSVRPESVAIDPGTARSQAAGAGAVLISEWIRGILRWFADEREDDQAQRQADAVSAAIAAHQAAKPADGALVRMIFHRQALPDAPGPGQARFAYLEHGFGASESEARFALNQQSVAAPTLGANVSAETREKWIPPVTPVAPSGLRPPFPRVATGGIRGTKLKFQDVKWDSGGFDDEAVTEVAFAREEDARSRSSGCRRSCRDRWSRSSHALPARDPACRASTSTPGRRSPTSTPSPCSPRTR